MEPLDVETALGLLASGAVPAAPFLTGQYPLAEVVDALEATGRQQGVKYEIVPPGAIGREAA